MYSAWQGLKYTITDNAVSYLTLYYTHFVAEKFILKFEVYYI